MLHTGPGAMQMSSSTGRHFDSQDINVVEGKEFRDFVLYGRDNVTERDLPHRPKLIESIFKAYEEEHRNLLDDFKVREISHVVCSITYIIFINL